MWKDDTFRVALFGHRDFDGHRAVEWRLSSLLKELIRSKTFVEIYVGRNGEFDIFSASVVKRVMRAMGNECGELICVLPYSQRDIEFYEKYYDSVIIPECVCGVHPKGAIVRRNRWMVEQASLVICYVNEEHGGTYEALRYAKRLGKVTINLAEADCDF